MVTAAAAAATARVAAGATRVVRLARIARLSSWDVFNNISSNCLLSALLDCDWNAFRDLSLFRDLFSVVFGFRNHDSARSLLINIIGDTSGLLSHFSLGVVFWHGFSDLSGDALERFVVLNSLMALCLDRNFHSIDDGFLCTWLSALIVARVASSIATLDGW